MGVSIFIEIPLELSESGDTEDDYELLLYLFFSKLNLIFFIAATRACGFSIFMTVTRPFSLSF